MAESILETFGLSKRFGHLIVSDAIDIDLRSGEIHAIIGPNGAGKSTLINQICGSLTPDAGDIRLMGNCIKHLDTAARARAGLGRTFQISNLAMEDTVLENVLLGVFGALGQQWSFWRPAPGNIVLRARAEVALSKVGLIDFMQNRCATLSHGQRRQLEVAVALALEPLVFVMDEPMAGLGAEGSKIMTGFLDQLRAQAPILLVEHDMDAVFTLADRISVLVYGKIIATGTVAEIRASSEVRDAYLGAAK